MQKNRRIQGFTLIELSIVLVIIGLIVGGVLVGQNLISSAAVRAQITQIEKFNQAVNTFYGKYGYLPGDITPAAATQFGFAYPPSRAGTRGRGDGNGLIEGYDFNCPCYDYPGLLGGETAFFWEDLSANSHMIEGTFNSATDSALGGVNGLQTLIYISLFLPQAKLNSGNLIDVYSSNGANYFTILGFFPQNGNSIGMNGAGAIGASLGLTVLQAYQIDKKIDDGIPVNGNVQATYINGNTNSVTSATNAASPSSSTCYDTTSNQYSITQNGGANLNCSLSFRFQ